MATKKPKLGRPPGRPKSKTKLIPIQTTIDPQLAQRIARLATARGLSTATWLRELILTHIDEEKNQSGK